MIPQTTIVTTAKNIQIFNF